jgi:tetratricopeptide (TPR) repeat protein
MNRLCVGGFVLASFVFVTIARAETQAEIAAKEDDDGKVLIANGNYKDATEKFRSAADRAPEAKYYFHLCASVYQQGIFGQALTACNNADKLNPDDALKAKIAKLEDKIKSDATAQHIDLNPTGVGGGGGPTNEGNPIDPNNNGGTNVMGSGATQQPQQPQQPQYAVGRPTQNLLAVAKPEHSYTWTLGIDIYGGGGQIGQPNWYGQSAGGFRVKGDYMLLPQYKVGAQIYLAETHFASGSDPMHIGDSLDIVDFGAAGYKHVCAWGRLCLTPLAGAHLALMSPANAMDAAGSQVFNYAAVGIRLEAALSYALGSRLEHVISVSLGLNAYSPVFSNPMDGLTATEQGLDKGGAVGYVGIGYTYRFNTPFGQAPFVTLD